MQELVDKYTAEALNLAQTGGSEYAWKGLLSSFAFELAAHEEAKPQHKGFDVEDAIGAAVGGLLTLVRPPAAEAK